MSTPDSLNPAPLTGLGDHSFRKVLEDDYSTGKLNLKLKASTAAFGTANYKGWMDLKNNQSQQETKFQFPFKRYFFQIATRENEVKLHADFGQVAKLTKGGVNLFANIKLTSANLSQAVVRVGGVTKWNDLTSHTRFEYNQKKDDIPIVDLLTRSSYKYNNWHFVASKELRLTTFQPKRHDFLVGYVQPKYDIFLRHLTVDPHNAKNFSELKPGRFLLDVVFRNNKQTYGAEVEYKFSNTPSLLLAASTKVNDVDVKARFNAKNLSLGVSAKGKLFDRFNWTLATEIPVSGAKPTSHGCLPVPLGFTLDTSL